LIVLSSARFAMSRHISNEFDPFRVVVSFVSEANSADLFIETFTGIGLAFDVRDAPVIARNGDPGRCPGRIRDHQCEACGESDAYQHV